MGFECGFYKMPRFRNITGSDVSVLNSYFNWERNYKDKFSFEDYVGGGIDEYLNPESKKDKFLILENKEAVDFYRPLLHDTGYGTLGIVDIVESWCSAGRYFNDWFIEHCNDGVDDCKLHKELTRDLMLEALAYVTDFLEKHQLEEWSVVNAFKENAETGEKTIIPCDGIEIQNEKGLIKRIYSDCDPIYFGVGYDSEEFNTFLRLKSTLQDMLINVDFEKEMVYYFTSW